MAKLVYVAPSDYSYNYRINPSEIAVINQLSDLGGYIYIYIHVNIHKPKRELLQLFKHQLSDEFCGAPHCHNCRIWSTSRSSGPRMHQLMSSKIWDLKQLKQLNHLESSTRYSMTWESWDFLCWKLHHFYWNLYWHGIVRCTWRIGPQWVPFTPNWSHFFGWNQ